MGVTPRVAAEELRPCRIRTQSHCAWGHGLISSSTDEGTVADQLRQVLLSAYSRVRLGVLSQDNIEHNHVREPNAEEQQAMLAGANMFKIGPVIFLSQKRCGQFKYEAAGEPRLEILVLEILSGGHTKHMSPEL